MRIVAVWPENRSRAFTLGSLRRLCVLLARHASRPLHTHPLLGDPRPFNRIPQKFLDFALPDGEFEGDRQDLLGRTEA